MEQPGGPGRLIVTPHPITLEGQRNVAAELLPRETLGAFLARTVPEDMGTAWEVRINGVPVPHAVMDRVRPKAGTVIEVRSVVNRQALAVVAMAALTYFTFGAGAYFASALINTTLFAAGSMLINKVLGPKLPGTSTRDQAPVYSIGQARNQARHYQPLPLVFGTVRYAPDIISNPYSWYEGTEQVMGMVLTPGVNAHSVEALYTGETALSTYQDVRVYHAGFPGMPSEAIPLYSNADTIAGGELNKNGAWVERATGPDTVRVQINLEYILGDQTSKGKPYRNRETVEVQYRTMGGGAWLPLITRQFVNDNYDQQRATLSADVPRGQYDVRVRRMGQAFEDLNGQAQFQYVSMTAVQADEADYAGVPRIGIRIRASGQINGSLDEVRCVVHSRPIPVWNGAAWVTQESSNPGAQILAYARGINDENGRRIAGIGLPDAMIDIPALQAFMLHCADNGYAYDFVVKEARSHAEMCDTLALAGFGQISWAGGRLSVVWAADDQPLSGVVNMATIKRSSFQVDYTVASAADAVEYTYYDRTDWSTKTLRVNMPGVTVALNPAQLQGEGVTSEAHAAELARYHLAQSLYQYKDIRFGADLEHLSYRRLSVLALQHDLTQWGYGGRLVAADVVGGQVTLELDEEVPQGSSPFIGLRIPGERVYRVLRVQPLAEASYTVTLLDPWPSDAPLPGASDGNPAHDTIWIYDFKHTPGYRVRVVSIEPESDYGGATVAVVPESPEFWNYVKTGDYVPPANQSLLPTRPVVSNLRISESQVVQGDTVFTELQATFDVDGPMAYCTVRQAQQLEGEWTQTQQVAEARTNIARWRIPGAGVYRITVSPYNVNGVVGGVATVTYATEGADIPPPKPDVFDVQELLGGVRRYSWSYAPETVQPANLAGVEIRYLAGAVATPDWDAMTPLGDTGYYTSAFEAALPLAGEWTFAARARNTAGELSEPRVLHKTLGASLGEIVSEIDPAKLVELQLEIEAERVERFEADAAEAAQRAADLLNQATLQEQALAAERAAREAAVAAAMLRIDAIDDDAIISPVEKPSLITDVQAIHDVYPRLRQQMEIAEVATDELDEAYSDLVSYLAELNAPVPWNDTSGDTYIT